MDKLLFLFALCVLPALVSARRPTVKPLIVQGRVYCDTCRAGFETSATTYLADAKVKVECRARQSLEPEYSIEGTTDSTGTYRIEVAHAHDDHFCDAVLVSSPRNDCASVDPGRERSRVILSTNNGIVSNVRFANSMGFLKDQPMSFCSQLLKTYMEDQN